ncbi:MAG: hypothetical protein K2R98_13695 [Gemmataceae bacterium]|nr:hypothetical protein [Gemmataceae bacterium]
MAKKLIPWPTKYPGNLLPRGGLRPFVAPKQADWARNKPRGPRDGYIDRDANLWIPHPPSPSGSVDDFHWDVQHPDGQHTNVAPDGSIHHGPDNFP